MTQFEKQMLYNSVRNLQKKIGRRKKKQEVKQV